MKNKKIIIISTIIAVIICICIVSAIFIIKEKNKQEEQKTIINIKELQEYEINTELFVKDLLADYQNIEIINNDEKIDTSVLGAKEITIQYKNVYKEENEEKKIEIKIIDTQAPQFEITNKELSFEQETEINLLENVKCTDNSNEQIEIKVEGDYDANTPGTYTIKYVAEDSSGNKVESEDITLYITEKQEQEPTTATTSTTTKSNNRNNTNSNSSSNNNYNEPVQDSNDVYERAKQTTISKYNGLRGKFFTYDPGVSGIEGHGYIESMSGNFWWQYSGDNWYVNNDCNNPLAMPNPQNASSFLSAKPSQDGEYAGQVSGSKVRLYWVTGYGID